MDRSGQNPTEDAHRLAELSALADGTLDPARRPEIRAWIESSDELRGRFEDERRAVALLSAAREREHAPAALRERIESTRRQAARTPGWRRRSPIGAAAVLAAGLAATVALILALPAGSPGSPSLAQAAALGTLSPTLPAPGPRPGAPAQLQAAVGQLHFPNWSATLGWRAVGQRRDRLGGRTVRTVYYAKRGHTVAYSIVSGSPLPEPSGTTATASGAVYAFRSLRVHGRNLVTWREGGRTCLLSGAGLSDRTLAGLIAHA